MIDLHIHTAYSDGKCSVIEILKQAEELKLNTISITDHETCEAYKELDELNIKDYYKGNIITGIELKAQYTDKIIDVLGYNIDYNKMAQYLNECYGELTRERIQEMELEEYYKYAKQYSLKIRPIQELEWDKKRDWAGVVFYNEIKKYEANKDKLPKDMLESFENYYSMKNEVFYINMSKYYPSLDNIIDIIHKSGGLAFVAHIYRYKNIENKNETLSHMIKEYELDGIECYYSTFTEEQTQYLIDLCGRSNLLISGGTDYHGGRKKDISLGTGKGNLEVPNEIICNWKKRS